MLKKILTEPLLHFAVIALGLFVLYEALNPEPGNEVIVVSEGRVDQLRSLFTKSWQREPTAEELDSLIRSYVLDEIYTREARALGLDKDDAVVRRRLRQKMEFMLQDMAAIEPPTETELQEYLQANEHNYRLPARYSFSQIYISTDRPRSELAGKLDEIRRAIDQGQIPPGDTDLLPVTLDDAPGNEVQQQFGELFVTALDAAPEGQWHGPVESGLGLHFVKLEQRTTGSVPELDQVRAQVVRDWQYQQNQRFKIDYEENVLGRYEISVSKPSPDTVNP